MNDVTRRGFVKAGSLALMSFGLEPIFLGRAAYAQRSSPRGKTLVCLFQRGAVDGLSMVVPHGDDSYYRERPRIALARNTVLNLDGQFGLHPALGVLRDRYAAGEVAIVHAVGSPDLTRSHFDAQDYLETGTPGVKSTTDGWANRLSQHREQHRNTPFRAVAFGPQLPRALAGRAPALAIDDLRAFGVTPKNPAVSDRLTRAFEDLYQGSATGLLGRSSAEAFEAIRMLRQADPTARAPANGASYPRGKLGEHLLQTAQLIKADVGLEIACVDVGGWDTHINQGSDQGLLAARLTELGLALSAFGTDLGDRLKDVVVLTMSEFGRTVRENGTGGTDHGHGTAMMVLGGGVRGGRVYGRWPGLAPDARHEGRDLAVTTDFRALFSEVLVGHLGATNLDQVFPGFDARSAPPLGIFG